MFRRGAETTETLYRVAGEEGGALERRSANGSGVLVDPQGFVVTNAHVVGSARRVQVLVPQSRNGKQQTAKLMPAEVMGVDRETDIAILKVEIKDGPYLEFGDSDQLRQGRLVVALGSPFGLANSVSMG